MDLNNHNNDELNTNCKVNNFYWGPIRQIIDNIEFFYISIY